jgi:hypothetical protein
VDYFFINMSNSSHSVPLMSDQDYELDDGHGQQQNTAALLPTYEQALNAQRVPPSSSNPGTNVQNELPSIEVFILYKIGNVPKMYIPWFKIRERRRAEPMHAGLQGLTRPGSPAKILEKPGKRVLQSPFCCSLSLVKIVFRPRNPLLSKYLPNLFIIFTQKSYNIALQSQSG